MRGEVKPKPKPNGEKDAQEVYSYREIGDMYNKTITKG